MKEISAALITMGIITLCFVIPIVLPLKSRCWFSKYFWDIHDYPLRKGGDGHPKHFHTYKCHRCGKKFKI